jgi:hypothetical protein
MGTTTDAVKSAVKGSVTEMESLVTEVTHYICLCISFDLIPDFYFCSAELFSPQTKRI